MSLEHEIEVFGFCQVVATTIWTHNTFKFDSTFVFTTRASGANISMWFISCEVFKFFGVFCFSCDASVFHLKFHDTFGTFEFVWCFVFTETSLAIFTIY